MGREREERRGEKASGEEGRGEGDRKGEKRGEDDEWRNVCEDVGGARALLGQFVGDADEDTDVTDRERTSRVQQKSSPGTFPPTSPPSQALHGGHTAVKYSPLNQSMAPTEQLLMTLFDHSVLQNESPGRLTRHIKH